MATIKNTPKSNTIIQVAEATGLSPATISRVLNNHPYVKEATKKKVLAMIEKLGYQRNNIASGLRSNKTRTIGLIVPRISMFFHAEVITTIQNSLYKHGYNLTICQSGDSVDMEKELIRTLQSVRVDAVIAACTLHTTNFTPFDQLMASGTPLIFYDRVPTGKSSAMIIKGDDIQGGYLATAHLIEIGCKKIAHISGPLDCNLYQDRLKGFYNAMKNADLPHFLRILLNSSNRRRYNFTAGIIGIAHNLQILRHFQPDFPGKLQGSDSRGIIVCHQTVRNFRAFKNLL